MFAKNVRFSFARFLIIFILTLFIVATIFFLFTTNFKKFWRKWKQSRYKHFQNYNEDGTDINGLQVSNANIFENSTPSIQFRTEGDNIYIPPTYRVPKKSMLARVKNFFSKKTFQRRADQTLDERDPVYLNSESDRTPNQLYRKYDKSDLNDEYFVDSANNVRPNPFIVHLL